MTSSPKRVSRSRWCRNLNQFADDVAAANGARQPKRADLLVGHSYGGSIITQAGIHPKVVGLVYVAAHAPDVGENESALGRKTPSILGRPVARSSRRPTSSHNLDTADFLTLFAPDLPREYAEFAARSQVLAAAGVFSAPLTAAAWKTKPCWGLVAVEDQIIRPNLERWCYARARSHTLEFRGASRAVFASHHEEVAAVIAEAARHVQK